MRNFTSNSIDPVVSESLGLHIGGLDRKCWLSFDSNSTRIFAWVNTFLPALRAYEGPRPGLLMLANDLRLLGLRRGGQVAGRRLLR